MQQLYQSRVRLVVEFELTAGSTAAAEQMAKTLAQNATSDIVRVVNTFVLYVTPSDDLKALNMQSTCHTSGIDLAELGF